MSNLFVDVVLSRGADDATFLREPDGPTLTYAEMRRRVERIAAALVALGVHPGDRVAAQIEKSTEGLMLYLAALTAGAAFLPLNIAYTAAELAIFLADAEPAVTVCDPSRLEAVRKIAPGIVLTLDGNGPGSLAERADAAGAAAQPVARNAEDLAAILYTSGTTGRSKGAMLTHGNLVSNADALAELWRFTADDRLLHALPIYHLHGLFTAVNTALIAGASLCFLRRFDAAKIVRAMPGATVMMGVPTFYARLLDHAEFTRETAREMRLFVSGSAPLLKATHQRFAERTGHVILERYGMTETNMTTSNPYDGERRAGTVGFPLPDVFVRVASDEGVDLPLGDIGMIEVKGPNVFKGYWRDPAKTADEFRRDGFFITGDIGRIDADGYLHITGRRTDLIITGGLNVYPKEVELAIDALPNVAESAVVGLPHADLGEAVTAMVVAASDARLDEANVLAALEARIARFKVPRRVIVVDELPRNAMGKVQKKVLRETFGGLYEVL